MEEGVRYVPLFKIMLSTRCLPQLKTDSRHTTGDVIRITVLGQPAIILSSMKAVDDLLESRGSVLLHYTPEAYLMGIPRAHLL